MIFTKALQKLIDDIDTDEEDRLIMYSKSQHSGARFSSMATQCGKEDYLAGLDSVAGCEKWQPQIGDILACDWTVSRED